MILLETHHPIFKSVFTKKMTPNEGGKYESVDSTLADEDGNLYHLHNMPKEKSKIVVEMSCAIYSDIKAISIDATFKSYFSAYESTTPSAKYHFAFVVDLDKFKDKCDQVSADFGRMRLRIYQSIFSHFFKAMDNGTNEKLLFTVRKGETVFIESKQDRITVTFCIDFQSEEDVTIGKIFMHEFKEGRKGGGAAPQVIVTHKDPPAELPKGKVPKGPTVGYITFVLTKAQHCKNEKLEKVTEMMAHFMPYFKMHMKCSKTYLNQRMRNKCSEFIKIIERAKPEEEKKEKKTASGKTFTRS